MGKMSNIPSIFIVKLKEIFSLKTHNHVKSEITNFAHTHGISEVTSLNSALSAKSNTGHKHTKSEITDFSHTHTKSQITDFAHTHTKSQISDFPVIPSGIPSGMICWFYLTSAPSGWKVCDGTNGTPNLIGRYPLGATGSIGSTVEAGLPNITGTLFALIKEGYNTSGAFSGGETVNGMDYQSSGTGTIPVSFDASRSSGVYGKSDTVTPPSVRLLPCMKI